MELKKVTWHDFYYASRVLSNQFLESEVTPIGISYRGLSKLDGFFSNVSFKWIKKVWKIIETTPLSSYSDEQGFYTVITRLFCLGEVVRMYHSCISEDYYDKYKQYLLWTNGEGWVGKRKNQFNDKFERVRFIVLAGEEYFEDGYMDDEGISDVIDHQRFPGIANTKL